MLNAVLFDLDDTLVDRDRAFRDCVHERFSDPAVRARLIELDQSGRGARGILFDFWTKQSGERMNQSVFGRMIARRLRPDPGLLGSLRALSKRVRLGIITNGSGETQRGKFQAAGLEEVISSDRVWVSEELGSAKPAPAIFLHAARALGAAPGHCLFIGDQEEDDVAGAIAAGMQVRLVTAVLTGERLNGMIRED